MLCSRYSLPLWRLRLMSSLGIAYASHGRTAEGLDLAEKALIEAESMTLIVDQPMFLVHIGLALLLEARFEHALKYGRRALDMALANEGKGDQAWARFVIGSACLRLGDSLMERATTELIAARSLANSCDARPLAAFCQTALGEIYRRGGEMDKAQDFTSAASVTYAELDMRALAFNQPR